MPEITTKPITDLSVSTNPVSGDKFLTVGSSSEYLVDIDNVANYIIEEYDTSSLGGSVRSVKDAIDAIATDLNAADPRKYSTMSSASLLKTDHVSVSRTSSGTTAGYRLTAENLAAYVLGFNNSTTTNSYHGSFLGSTQTVFSALNAVSGAITFATGVTGANSSLRRLGQFVIFALNINAGSSDIDSGETVLTFPSGFRPPSTREFIGHSNGVFQRFMLNSSTGEMKLYPSGLPSGKTARVCGIFSTAN